MKRAIAWIALLFILAISASAGAIDRTFAASSQIDYHLAPSELKRTNYNAFDGATLELGLKLAVDLSDHFSANVKVCFGCHGFETDMAYVDYRVSDELNFRLGRFSPSFGAFNLRHDPANHRLSDKPLPYDMGRMLRLRDWNMGVLPSPFPDNGLEINGTHWFGSKVQFDWAAYGVSGFKAEYTALDLDFVQSRNGNLYYVDNNSAPSFGARLAFTFKLGERSDLTIGGSGMAGTFDPRRELWYMIAGADFALRLSRTTIRAEWLARRQDFDEDAATFRYVVNDDNKYFMKHGAYVELEQPLTQNLDLILRADGMYRIGNVPVSSPLDKEAWVGRGTLGVAYLVERHLRLKASAEYWEFDGGTASRAVSFHLGAAATF
jgi:hypothetical protein